MKEGEALAVVLGLLWLWGARAARRVPGVNVARWTALLVPGCLANGIQLPYALKWIEIESGGNPCAIGDPSQRGPDGQPRELGIAQLHNPDDLRRVGVTGAELRAYCVPGTAAMSRAMTIAEMAT